MNLSFQQDCAMLGDLSVMSLRVDKQKKLEFWNTQAKQKLRDW